MKIINQTADEMVLKDGQPILGLFMGIIFMIVGGGLSYVTFIKKENILLSLFCAIFFLIGFLMILLGSTITVDILKSQNKILYGKKSLIRNSLTNYDLSNVLRVETRKAWQTRSNGNRGGYQQILVSQSVIVFKDGSEIPIDNQNSGSSLTFGAGIIGSGQARETIIANQVAQFIGMPFQEIDPPNQNIGMGGMNMSNGMGTGTGINVGGVGIRL